jgi:peptide/nickel transport system ATP-binding protein
MYKRGERLPVVSDFLNAQLTGTDSKEYVNTTDKTEPMISQTAINSQKQQAAHNRSQQQDHPIILSVENLKVYYPGKKVFFGKTIPPFKAVDDVSFTMAKGETVGLVGESGCGKTTLGRTILQLIKPTEGAIILNGVDLATLSKAAMQPIRKDLQIVFQDPYGSLNPRLTIGSAIQEPMKVHSLLETNSQRKDKVIELLEKVNLKAEHFYRYPHQFSGGQRQRICIARALALNPSFLIFDESVSALDVSVQAQVLNLLNDLRKEFGFTSIFISHDLSVVRFISDRIMVMNKGKIIEEGPSDEIYFSPQNEYTKQLIDAIPGKKIGLSG